MIKARIILCAMARKGVKLTIKQAFVLNHGIVGEARQSTMGTRDWQDVRSEINRHFPSHIAFCIACNAPVFVKAANSTKVRPHFAHRGSVGLSCLWSDERTNTPDQRRAQIFGGNQESDVHRAMCNLVVELVSADERYIENSGKVDEYFKPEEGGRGRWPDARFELKLLGKFAIEVQFAPSLATEVVGRSEFYMRERINLIWLLPWYSFEQVQRAFAEDIAHEAKGNYFVLDYTAIEESRKSGTLKLWAAWKNGNELKKKIVSLDDLTYSQNSHPFYTDKKTLELFATAIKRRENIYSDLLNTKRWSFPKPKILSEVDSQPEFNDERFLRIIFSIWSATLGSYKNLENNLPNLVAQLNAYLESEDGKERTNVVWNFIKSTRAQEMIKETTITKIRAGKSKPQLDSSNEWVSFIYGLFPEVFRADLRALAQENGTLPEWAKSSEKFRI